MAGVFKIKNVEDAEFTLTHPDGAGAVSIASNNIAKVDVINTALGLKANIAEVIGVGQTWQDVTASRVLGVTYINTTGKPISVSILSYGDDAGGSDIFLYVNNTLISAGGINDGIGVDYCSASALVPNGSNYKVTVGFRGGTVLWYELR